MFFLFFHTSRHHQDLHSFPTRRSSDLKILEEDCKKLNKRFFIFHTEHRPYIILKWAQTADGKIAISNSAKGKETIVQDRKSTRLNSSHTVISYAVFCLKKKKSIVL